MFSSVSSTCNEQSISNKEEAERESPVLNNDQTSTVCEPTAVATIRLLGKYLPFLLC